MSDDAREILGRCFARDDPGESFNAGAWYSEAEDFLDRFDAEGVVLCRREDDALVPIPRIFDDVRHGR